MKTILKLCLPVSAFVLAIGGAINSQMSKEHTTKPLITGYVHNGTITNCYARIVDCTQANTGQICMSSDTHPEQVFGKNAANMCTIELYKVIHCGTITKVKLTALI